MRKWGEMNYVYHRCLRDSNNHAIVRVRVLHSSHICDEYDPWLIYYQILDNQLKQERWLKCCINFNGVGCSVFNHVLVWGDYN